MKLVTVSDHTTADLQITHEIVNVILHRNYSSFLFQLRDLIPTIDYPGHWGGFGGSIEPGEFFFSAGYRELEEELCYTPPNLYHFRTYIYGHKRIYMCYCELVLPLSKLKQGEGMDMELFSRDQIFNGPLYSQKLNDKFPVAPPLLEIFEEFFKDLEE